TAEVVPVGDVAEIAQDLGLRRVALGPPPFGLQLEIEAVGVVDALDVAARARVAVPVPRPADVVGALEDGDREPEPAQVIKEVQSSEPGAHADHVDVPAYRALGVGCHVAVLARSVAPSRRGGRAGTATSHAEPWRAAAPQLA